MTNPISPRNDRGDCAARTVATQASPGAATASPPFGECQLSQVIDELFAIKTPDVEWLERAGPIARRLNEESKHD